LRAFPLSFLFAVLISTVNFQFDVFAKVRCTRQTCSKCRHFGKNSRNGEKFICTNCGHTDDANLQAARNVKTKAIETYGLNIVKIIESKKVRRDSSKPVQTTLFNVGMYERSSDNTLPQKGKRRVGENPEYKQLVRFV